MWGAHPRAPHVDRSMHKYVIRRLLLAVPVLVLASLIFPGLAISLAVLGFNLFGDTLRDAWDPKLRSRG